MRNTNSKLSKCPYRGSLQRGFNHEHPPAILADRAAARPAAAAAEAALEAAA
jgi:hypothetical protein